MGLLEDICVGVNRVGERLEAASRAIGEWAATEAGQNVLATLDFAAISSRLGDFYAHTGWYLPVHPALHRYALEHLEHRCPFDARRAARLVGPGSTHWPWIVEGTLASPVLQSRSAVVQDAIFCMEHARWHAAISTLLPVIEGVVSDGSGIIDKMRVGRRVNHLLYTECAAIEAISAVPALDLLDAEVFASQPFAGASVADSALNRHLVVHGRTSGFGTQINGGLHGSVHHRRLSGVVGCGKRGWCVVERGFGLSAVEQELVWELWGAGKSMRGVAREMGRHVTTIRQYVASTGGQRPVARRRAPGCLSMVEREEISRGLARRDSCRQIASCLGRSHTTVSREVHRNGGRDSYRAEHADRAGWRSARRPKPAKLSTNALLRALVEEKLELRWSPQQIAGWLGRTYPDDGAMRISHETIYLSLFVQSRGALRHELTAQLRSGRVTRRPQGRVLPSGKGQLTGKLMISERPAEAHDRAVPGHWEGDLLLGKRPSAIATLVERSSRYTQLVALPDGHKADAVRVALTASIATLPEQLRRSLTWDQGKEMAEHARFSIDSGISVYFCDPRSPWQRGSNENTNGLLRQYFPKRSDVAVSQAHLDAVAAELNGRPRKTLGWMTPAEKLAELTAPV